MFILDGSLPGIQAIEPEVEAVYRSKVPITIPLPDLPPAVCEGFVCLVRKEEKRDIYLALYLKDSRKCLVLVPDRDISIGAGGEENLLQDALELAGTLGFAMECLNLGYGTALREVLVRSIPVILGPEAFRRALAPRIGGERLSAPSGNTNPGSAGAGRTPSSPEGKGSEPGKSSEGGKSEKGKADSIIQAQVEAVGMEIEKISCGLATSRKEAAASDSAARAEKERLGEERAAAEKRIGDLLQDQERLVADKSGAERRAAELARAVRGIEERLAAERADRERLAAEKKEVEKRAAELARTARESEERLAAERTERERLKAGKTGEDRLVAEKAEIEARAAELAESVRLTEERLAAERKERERLASEKDLAERLLEELTRAVKVAEENTAAERAARERLETQRGEWERLAQEKVLVEKQVKELAEAKKAAERMEKERMAAERQSGERLETEKKALQSKLEELLIAYREAVEKFEAERSERERLVVEKSRAEKQLRELSLALRSAEEKVSGAPAEKAEVKRLLAAKADAEARAEELRRALQLTREEAEFDRRERERLAAEKVLAERRLEDLTAGMESGQEKGPGKKEEKKGLPRLNWVPGSREKQALQSGPPSGALTRSSFQGASFQIDWSLPFVAYSDVEEVAEVYQSIGPSQLSLEGFSSQYCSAYVIVLKREARPKVYVAFLLSSDNRVLVYVPVREPGGSAEFKKVKEEAMQFVQLAGYMLDRVPLDPGREIRARVLEDIPVLAGPAPNVQGF
jgi:hypothetical protein